MLKRFLSFVLILTLFSVSTFASAADLWGSVVGFLGDAWNSVSDVVDEGLDDVSEIAGDVRDWTSEAAGDAWDWSTEAARDVWDWTSETAGEVWDWTSAAAGDVWDWSSTLASESWAWTAETMTEIGDNIGSWISLTGEGALDALQDVWNMLLTEAGATDDRAAETWNELMKYAEDNDIDPLKLAKLAISIVIKVGASFIPGPASVVVDELLNALLEQLFTDDVDSEIVEAEFEDLEQSIDEFSTETN